MTEKQMDLLGLKPGYKLAISQAKRAFKKLNDCGVGLMCNGRVSFRPRAALDPRFELGDFNDLYAEGGDGGDECSALDATFAMYKQLEDEE